MPSRLVLALAAFIRLYKGEWQGETIPLNDDPQVLAWFRQHWAEAESVDSLVAAVLGNIALWDRDLRKVSLLSEKVADNLRAIEAGQLLDLL